MTTGIYRYLKVFFISMALVFCLVTVQRAFAMDASTSAVAQKYSISFPIAELGNCDSISSCKAYCDDSSHLDACVAFAKSKGFYRTPATPNPNQNATLEAAKTELGCSSEDECKAFCSQQSNQQICMSFAQKHGLHSQGAADTDQTNKTLALAKSILGCQSAEECKTFCSESQNQQKCSDFAKQAGIGGGMQKVGPGGCTSEDSCKTYCSEHESDCNQFMQSHMKPGENMPPNASASGFRGGPDGRPTFSPNPQASYSPAPGQCKSDSDCSSGQTCSTRGVVCSRLCIQGGPCPVPCFGRCVSQDQVNQESPRPLPPGTRPLEDH